MAKRIVSKGITRTGKLLSLLRANGEWMAIVACISTAHGDPVISQIVRVQDMQGRERKRADSWVEQLA